MINRVGHLFGRALRESGQALDRTALRIAGDEFFQETYTRHRPEMVLYGKAMTVEKEVFIAPSAAVIGEVSIKSKSSIWYGAVLRADTDSLTIGEYTNVQDRAIIVTKVQRQKGVSLKVSIGDYVTIGHGAMLTSCTVGNHVLIGQGAIVSEGAVIGDKSMIAAGAVVLPDTEVPGGQLWGGNPAAFIRDLSAADIEGLEKIWYGAVLRADTDSLTIGEYTNVQDRAIIVTKVQRQKGVSLKVSIGDYVTIGHGAMLTSCTVGNHVLIGQGAIVSEGAVIGDKSMIAAGAVVLPDTEVPGGQLWGGNPAAFIRDLSAADIEGLEKSASSYSVLAAEHAKDVPTYL